MVLLSGHESAAAGNFNRERFVHELKNQIVGQDRVIDDIAIRLQRRIAARSGQVLKRPFARFMFFGPTGTGKTELANLIAQQVFPRKSVVRVDFGNLSMSPEVLNTFLFGLPKGYVNAKIGLFYRELGASPDKLVLFDEIEKANVPNVMDLLLRILDEGVGTDLYEGRQIDFRRTIIVMTSNLVFEELLRIEDEAADFDERQRRFREHLRNAGSFKAELLGRIDDIFVFRPFSPQSIQEILLVKLSKMVASRTNLRLVHIAPEAAYHLFERVSRQIGASGARAFESVLEDELAMEIFEASRLAGPRPPDDPLPIHISRSPEGRWVIEAVGEGPPDEPQAVPQRGANRRRRGRSRPPGDTQS
jgi:ATP-dependent Clp protease ATP-binding subunit ClpB